MFVINVLDAHKKAAQVKTSLINLISKKVFLVQAREQSNLLP